MQILIATRGSKRDVDRFIEEMQSKYLPIKVKGKNMVCNVVYRPIQLGELVFPKERLQTILNTLEPMNWKRKFNPFNWIRKMIKFKKVPEADGKTLPLPVWNKNIELNIIGLKEDKFLDGHEQL